MTGAAADPTPDKTIPASVIVVSRHRPGALLRCLTALAQSDHPCFEVIVVADPGGLAAVAQSVFRDTVKTAACDVANIPLARNTGLGLAAAPVVAFIDDDAVAESTWLSRLTAPFANPRVSAAGGFVRGRNGISHQWKAREIDRDALETPLTVDE
ncbi:MAG: glycosyltransferase family 2 protein, partial [Roseovarius sp.]|nr:glycosyltransferase family 2 protein [Roseovarius sp.]